MANMCQQTKARYNVLCETNNNNNRQTDSFRGHQIGWFGVALICHAVAPSRFFHRHMTAGVALLSLYAHMSAFELHAAVGGHSFYSVVTSILRHYAKMRISLEAEPAPEGAVSELTCAFLIHLDKARFHVCPLISIVIRADLRAQRPLLGDACLCRFALRTIREACFSHTPTVFTVYQCKGIPVIGASTSRKVGIAAQVQQ